MNTTERYIKHTKEGIELYFDKELRDQDYLTEYRMKKTIPTHISEIRGGIGGRYVVKKIRAMRLPNGKRIKPKIIITKFPDMSNIIATKEQRSCRNHFQEAVEFARQIIADPELKLKWSKRYFIHLRKVYNKALSKYLKFIKGGEAIEPALLPVKEEVVEITLEEPMVQSGNMFVNPRGKLLQVCLSRFPIRSQSITPPFFPDGVAAVRKKKARQGRKHTPG